MLDMAQLQYNYIHTGGIELYSYLLLDLVTIDTCIINGLVVVVVVIFL